jgi:hypothetical protein
MSGAWAAQPVNSLSQPQALLKSTGGVAV